jgi:hypothetical protein
MYFAFGFAGAFRNIVFDQLVMYNFEPQAFGQAGGDLASERAQLARHGYDRHVDFSRTAHEIERAT